MSVDPVNPSRRNPWKVATIVLAVIMALGLAAAAVAAIGAFAFSRGHSDYSYGMKNGRPCMGAGCMAQGCKGMGCDMGMGGGMGMGKGMQPGSGPVIVQRVEPAGPMPTAMPAPADGATPVIIWSGPIGEATPGGDQTPVIIYSVPPAPTSGEIVTYDVTPMGGAPDNMTCSFDGTTVTCSGDSMGAMPYGSGQQQCKTSSDGSTVCWGTSWGNNPGYPSGGNVSTYGGSQRGSMMGMVPMMLGGLITFAVALAALIVAILAYRRSRPRPATLAAAAPVVQVTPLTVAHAAPAEPAAATEPEALTEPAEPAEPTSTHRRRTGRQITN